MEESPQADAQLIQPGCDRALRSEQGHQLGVLPHSAYRCPVQSQNRRELGSFKRFVPALMSQALSICRSIVHPAKKKAPRGSRAVTDVSKPLYVFERVLWRPFV